MTNPRSLLKIIVFISVLWPQEVSCSNETKYYQNDYIEFSSLASEDTLSGQILPSGTGVHFSENMIIEEKSYKKTDAVRFDLEGNLLNEY